ncbi:MAG TPA: MBL fold metallo-hydrolase [Pseudonocardiaceae bacterium]|jgi:glyoxylase-like metal-dependent hydrolase (beta-lactamase superfamily II)|nr:MBL fold metallo-hydrolase [Pseudonocardiaceae bacterium]
MIDFASGAPVVGDLDVRWNHGSRLARRNTDPPIQVHAYDEHTLILRQNKAVHYEAPFLYLLFGNDRALLLDTGATPEAELFPLRATVDRLVDEWLTRHPRDDYELVVVHSHGHGDHTAADGQFADRPSTRVVPAEVDAVREFFGLTDWPAQIVPFDLGGRILEVTGIPGHHAASIAIVDPWSGFLLTGDTVLPGRLYVFDFPAFADSMRRLVDLAASRNVTWVMGCHVEMTGKPRRDYPIGAGYQPRERPLQFTVAQLRTILDATESVSAKPGVHVFDDVVIYHGQPGKRTIRIQTARNLAYRAKCRVLGQFLRPTPA